MKLAGDSRPLGDHALFGKQFLFPLCSFSSFCEAFDPLASATEVVAEYVSGDKQHSGRDELVEQLETSEPADNEE